MPKPKAVPIRETPAVSDSDETSVERNGREIPPDAAALISQMAARGRARRRQVEAMGTPPWEAIKMDPAWQQRWRELIAQIRSEIPPDLTPEEIEAEITRVADDLREERLARGL